MCINAFYVKGTGGWLIPLSIPTSFIQLFLSRSLHPSSMHLPTCTLTHLPLIRPMHLRIVSIASPPDHLQANRRTNCCIKTYHHTFGLCGHVRASCRRWWSFPTVDLIPGSYCVHKYTRAFLALFNLVWPICPCAGATVRGGSERTHSLGQEVLWRISRVLRRMSVGAHLYLNRLQKRYLVPYPVANFDRAAFSCVVTRYT